MNALFRSTMGVFAIVIAAVFPLAADETPAQQDLPLATVNGDPITGKDVVDLFNSRHAGHAKFLGGDVEARKFLDIVIDDRLLIQEAYELGIDESAEVQRYVEQYARGETAKYFVAKEITEAIAVDTAEVKGVWETWLEVFLHARHVRVDTRQEADEVRAAILKGTDIDALARGCSVADSRLRGGHIAVGWGQFPPSWEKVVFSLQPGEVSSVIDTPEGFEVVLLVDRIDVPRPELEKVAKKIEETLFQRKLEARKRTVEDMLWKKYKATLLVQGLSPAAALRLVRTAPRTVVAEWIGGGRLMAGEVFDLEQLSREAPQSGWRAVIEQIRRTVNASLVALEAKERRLDEVPLVARTIGRYRDYVVESVLFRDHIFRSIEITDADAESYYREHQKEFEVPEQRRVFQILVATEEEATAIRAEALKDADFVALVRKHSRDMVSAASDGDLGWITPDKVPPGLEEILSAKEGEVTKPFRSRSGWHVFKITEMKARSTPPFEEVREKVRERALGAKKTAARARWIDKLRAASEIEIDDAAISTFVKANESAGVPPQHAMD